jgi:hypothetical protein
VGTSFQVVWSDLAVAGSAPFALGDAASAAPASRDASDAESAREEMTIFRRWRTTRVSRDG